MATRSRRISMALAAALLFLGVSGANAEPGMAEKAGKGIDQVAAKVAKGVSVAVEKTGEALEKAGEKVQQFVRKGQREQG